MSRHAEVEKLIADLVEKYPSSPYGSAHIVVDDGNLENGHIEWCLGLLRAELTGDVSQLKEEDQQDDDFLARCDDQRPQPDYDCTAKELRATIKVLEAILAIPVNERYRDNQDDEDDEEGL